MSLSLRDAISADTSHYLPSKSEVCGFLTLAEADVVAAAIRGHPEFTQGYEVLTFAAGLYYVLLITPDFVEAKDGPASAS